MQNHVVKPPEHLRNIQVMVVDNDKKILGLMAHVLKYLGFVNVFSAQDGFKAVEIMRAHTIDLIITDWEIQPLEKDFRSGLPVNPVVRSDMWTPVPPKDGACFVQYIRSSQYSPAPFIPVIMMTGIGLKNYIEYARDSGVNEIVLKPFSMEDLCARISRIIDFPRIFVTSEHYKGPCRRREARPYTAGQIERRRRDVRIFKNAS
jgi:two-component system, chemotaxis family, chemotaxis protein CheY